MNPVGIVYSNSSRKSVNDIRLFRDLRFRIGDTLDIAYQPYNSNASFAPVQNVRVPEQPADVASPPPSAPEEKEKEKDDDESADSRDSRSD